MSYTISPVGWQPQPLDNTDVNTTSAANTDILNQASEAGILHSVSVKINTVLVGNTTAALEIQVDGGTTQSIPVFAAGLTFVPALRGQVRSGTGTIIDDFVILTFHAPYAKSIRVSLNVTIAGATGQVKVTVSRSKKV